jgi:transposase
MHERNIFKQALGWKDVTVRAVSLDADGVVLDVRPQHPRPVCAKCGHGVSALYDRHPPRTWRHLDLAGMALKVRYALRRVNCRRCGVVVEAVPWAEKGAWHTKEFEDATAFMAQRCDKTTVTDLMRIAWKTVGTIIQRAMARRQDGDPLAGLTHIGVDELSYRKHHEYITVVYDHLTGRVVWAHPGKSAETFGLFFKELGQQRCSQLKAVTMDMSPAYISAAEAAAPQAMLIFDRFHVQRMAHDAVDEVRREAVRRAGRGKAGRYLKNMRWALQKNPWNLTVSQKEKMSTLERKNRLLYRAYLLKEKLAEIMDGRQWRLAGQRLDAWIDWARKAKLQPFEKLAETIWRHREGVLNYVKTRLTNAPVEGLNGKIRTITRRSFGFHGSANLIAMIFLCCSGLHLEPVHRYPVFGKRAAEVLQ